MTVEITREQATQMAIDVCNSLTELQQSFLDGVYNITFLPEQALAIAETQAGLLDKIQFEVCPNLVQRIVAGEVSKLGDLQRLVKEATMATQAIANEYNAFYTLPGVIEYFIATPFMVDGTPLEDLTTKVAGYAVAIGAIALVLIFASK